MYVQGIDNPTSCERLGRTLNKPGTPRRYAKHAAEQERTPTTPAMSAGCVEVKVNTDGDNTMEEANATRVFVYGTLKQGHCNYPALGLGGAEFLGRHVLPSGYQMVNLGWYPGVIRVAAATNPIYGEVYRVDEPTLHALDGIEGHPTYYERVKIDTPFKNAWIYLLPTEYLEGNELVADGAWEPSAEEERYIADVSSAS